MEHYRFRALHKIHAWSEVCHTSPWTEPVHCPSSPSARIWWEDKQYILVHSDPACPLGQHRITCSVRYLIVLLLIWWLIGDFELNTISQWFPSMPYQIIIKFSTNSQGTADDRFFPCCRSCSTAYTARWGPPLPLTSHVAFMAVRMCTLWRDIASTWLDVWNYAIEEDPTGNVFTWSRERIIF